ncbi:MAG: ABC transporter permease subunit [Nitrospirales bacterium]
MDLPCLYSAECGAFGGYWVLIRTTEEGFRAIPAEQRLSAAALGLSRQTTVCAVLLPAAIPGVLVGSILGLGRAFAETAALIFTSGYVDRMPESLLDSGRALSVHIYEDSGRGCPINLPNPAVSRFPTFAQNALASPITVILHSRMSASTSIVAASPLWWALPAAEKPVS